MSVRMIISICRNYCHCDIGIDSFAGDGCNGFPIGLISAFLNRNSILSFFQIGEIEFPVSAGQNAVGSRNDSD